MPSSLSPSIKKSLLLAQCNEITEYFIYQKLAASIKQPHNQKILNQIAEDELRHYKFWQKYTQSEVQPKRFDIWLYFVVSKLFGITFGLRFMEKGEQSAQIIYKEITKFIPEAKAILDDEDTHEQKLIGILNEEKLNYVDSIVLGLNDALVELTGALAGFTLALQNTQLIAIVGLITGISAALSMAASEYLSTSHTENKNKEKKPLRAAFYTGITYMLTVLFLVFPYFVFQNMYVCLGITLFNALLAIFLFTFYISVAKNILFGKNFLKMAAISLGVAGLSFGMGALVRWTFGISA